MTSLSKPEIRRTVDTQGRLIKEEVFVDGLLHGVSRIWSSAGALLGEAEYVEGKLEGHSTLWDTSGIKILDAFYEAGELSGPYASWWGNGAIKEKGNFHKGTRIGIFQWFSSDGSLLSEASYPEYGANGPE